MHVAKTNFNGNSNIGLYAFTTDEYCLAGLELSNKDIKLLEKILKVPVHQLNIGGTSLLGVFLVGNNNCLLVPEICFDSELEELDRLGIRYKVIKSKLTALGNNIIVNDKVVLINEDFKEKEQEQISTALNVPLKTTRIANLSTIGSLAVLNKKGCLLHRDTTPEEIKFMVNNLAVRCDTGTVNMGNPYVKAGIITNRNGFLIGDQSSGFEQSFVDEALGFLE